MNLIHTYNDIKNKKVIFFDLDGTLINTVSGKTFPEDVTDFRINKTILDNIKDLPKLKFVFVVSNQAGIPQYQSRKDFEVKFNCILDFIKGYINNKEIGKEVFVKGLYCTAKGFNSKNRKPNTGMLERCLKDWKNLQKEEMMMVGDASGIHNDKGRDDFSDSDLRCARNFNIDYMDVDDLKNLTIE